ncbi:MULTISPECIES: hypothetical protein [Streptomyces]|uniref:hypothetical protein n=1 Tax=Streptomyces TaxID=1883 RepID=UPI0011F38B5B|nr:MULTISPECIES: hypothetical protein [Streptomyces]
MEPYPGSAGAKWLRRCVECGNVVLRPSTGAVAPCTHPASARRRAALEAEASAKADAEYRRWLADMESGAGIGEEVAWLHVNGWEPVEPFPGIDEPWRVRCVRCGHEKGILVSGLTPTCSHPGQEDTPALTSQGRSERVKAWKVLHDARYESEAAAAGWEPAEPRPSRGTVPWKLRCRTCGELVMVQVSKGEHRQECPHRWTPQEEAARERFEQAGWKTVEKAVRGGRSDKWRLRCPVCGYETRRAPIKRVRPCTHPNSQS